MQGERFVGYLPENIEWGDLSRNIYFSWNPNADTLRSVWKVKLGNEDQPGAPTSVEDEELLQLSNPGGYNSDYSQKVYAKNGDLYLLDLSKRQTLQLTNTLERERNPQFSGNGEKIVFQKGNNLFVWEMSKGTISQLTDFQKGYERNENPKTKQEQWLEDDQLALFDILAERKAVADARERREEELEPTRPQRARDFKSRASAISPLPQRWKGSL